MRARIVAWIASRPENRTAFAPVIDAAIGDADAEVRNAALRGLGSDAGAWLIRRVDGAGLPAERERALRLLGDTGSPEIVWPVLDRCLDGFVPELLAVAIAMAGDRKETRAAKRLAALATSADAPIAAAAVGALGAIGDAAAEPTLLAALARWEVPVKRAAAGALAELGTIAAVEALQRETEGLFADAEVKRLARIAVKAIQDRLGPVDAGRLTIAEETSDAGRLVLSSGEGDLALPENPESGT